MSDTESNLPCESCKSNVAHLACALARIAELEAALEEYMSQIGQGYAANGLPFGPAQQAADARARAALAKGGK